MRLVSNKIVRHPEWLKAWELLNLNNNSGVPIFNSLYQNRFCDVDSKKHFYRISSMYVNPSPNDHSSCFTFVHPIVIKGILYNAVFHWFIESNSSYQQFYFNTNWIESINYNDKKYGPNDKPPTTALPIKWSSKKLIKTF